MNKSTILKNWATEIKANIFYLFQAPFIVWFVKVLSIL